MKIVTLAILLLMHPVHVSLTGIEYDGGNRIYSVFVKVWSDDLASDMNLGNAGGVELTGDEEQRHFDYLADRISILEDGKKLEMKLLGSEVDGLEHRFRLEAKGRKGTRSVTVVNRIMTRLYSDQANMVLFSYDGVEDGYRFTSSDTLKVYNVK